jgi:hypothetical protein
MNSNKKEIMKEIIQEIFNNIYFFKRIESKNFNANNIIFQFIKNSNELLKEKYILFTNKIR